MAEQPNDLKTAENLGNPGKIGYLAFAALPVAIYVLAMIIFEQGDVGSLALESRLAAIAHAQKINTALELFTEGRLRVLWLSSVLLYYILAVAVIVISILALKNSLTPKGFRVKQQARTRSQAGTTENAEAVYDALLSFGRNCCLAAGEAPCYSGFSVCYNSGGRADARLCFDVRDSDAGTGGSVGITFQDSAINFAARLGCSPLPFLKLLLDSETAYCFGS